MPAVSRATRSATSTSAPTGPSTSAAGDGASFNFADYGQGGGGAGSPTPKNPCGDPPAGAGGTMTPPTAEGGALRGAEPPPAERPARAPERRGAAGRSGDRRRAARQPPGGEHATPTRAGIVGYGFRNPFRFTIRPLSNELWIGDVGWDDWEEINRQPSPTSAALNFGWPCYEGNRPQPGYQSAGLNLCSSLYSAGIATPPYFTYNHSAHVVAGDSCPTGSSSITGLAFYTGASNYPASYNDGLFFARLCPQLHLVHARRDATGSPTRRACSRSHLRLQAPVDLEIGPNGDLFYADLEQRARSARSSTPAAATTRRWRSRPRPRRSGTRR